jgi:hypothetical protein
LGLIHAKDWNINPCQSPEWYRIDIFPEKFKQEVIYPAYEQHLEWLEPQDSLKRATSGYKSLLSLMRANTNDKEWNHFKTEIYKLDKLRNENFWETFPEFKDIK